MNPPLSSTYLLDSTYGTSTVVQYSRYLGKYRGYCRVLYLLHTYLLRYLHYRPKYLPLKYQSAPVVTAFDGQSV